MTGRRDLVNAAGADVGSVRNGTYYINAGARLLDRMQVGPKTKAWHKEDIAAGDHKLVFQNARALLQVWVMDADGRTKLIRSDLAALRENYADPIADLDTGQPKYWAPIVMGLQPAQAALTKGAGANVYTGTFTFDWEDIVFSDQQTDGHYGYNGIIFMPPSDGVYTLSVLGQFYSRSLVADSDTNYWSTVEPELLAMAAACQIEVEYRNSEGVRDWLSNIRLRLSGQDNDMAAEEAVGITGFGG